jgi:HAD superfamily hydrolase (TIGR01509 family)
MKPAHGFYDAIINDQKIDPFEMLFIDDIAENVNAAKNAGMQAIRFEGVEKLNASLNVILQ